MTMIKQAGYDIAQARVVVKEHTRHISVREIQSRNIIEEVTSQWLERNGLNRSTKLYMHFDVLLELIPIP